MIAFITFVAFALLAVAALAVLVDCAIRGYNQSIWMRQQSRLYRALNSGVRSTSRITVPTVSKATVKVIDPADNDDRMGIAA